MTTATEPTTRWGKASDLGYDATDGAWVAVCVPHNVFANLPTRDMARAATKDTTSFCNDCRAEAPDSPEDETLEPPLVDPDGRLDESGEPAYSAPPKRYLPDPEPVDLEPERGVPPVELDDLLDNLTGDDEPRPALGPWFANGSGKAHYGASESGLYFAPSCGNPVGALKGEPTDPSNPDMCTYCLAGIPAPVETAPKPRKVREPRKPKAPKVVAAPEPAPEPIFTDETTVLSDYVNDLLTALTDKPSVPDAQALVTFLEPALAKLKAMLPRRRVGAVTGARSGLVKQSATVNPSEQLERVTAYADAGDKRARVILDHVGAYVPGEDCSYCLEHHGKTTRHGYATAFCSIGRELTAMANRAATAGSSDPA